MNLFYLGMLLAYGLWTIPTPSGAFIARSSGCHHNGTWYADKSLVPTVEKCLNCQCNRKTLVCRLKVCPEMPIPPPRGCVVVQKKNTCCPYLSCARLEAFYKIPITRRIIAYLDHYERESIDRVVNDNMLQRRSDDSETDLLVCVKNGTVYKSGSAMSSSNLCSYCYCIGGTEKCVKPKCMLPVEGCKPIFVDSTCCPVRYDCSAKTSGKSSQEVRYRKASNKHFQRMSQRLQRNRGCTMNKQFYAEGQKMKSDADKPCDICFCIRGSRRCAPKKCAPALRNCIPVVPKGQCCPSSYDCGTQRDYRRSQNSRQFNLFSLLFGKDENKAGSSTIIPEHYPHDRDPAITAGVSQYKTHEMALEASSEKSILDTIREGLEFIDGNTNHMLEENLDLVNLQAKRESLQTVESTTLETPVGDTNSSTTELSFLDLILGESSEELKKNEDTASTTPSTPVPDELSWVDILLGPEEENRNITHGEQNVSSSSTNIERSDLSVEELGSSGEIIVGTIEDFADKNTEDFYNSTHSNETEKLKTKPHNTQHAVIRPIPLHDESERPSNPGEDIKSNNTQNGLLNAFLDGINDILNSEKLENISSTTSMTATTNNITSTEEKLTTTKPLPIFKPLPTQKHKAHTRINSKIANLIVSPPTVFTNKHKNQNTTIKNNKTSTTLSTTSSTTTTTSTTTQKPTQTTKTTTTTTTTTPKPIIIKTNPTILEAEPLDDSTEPTLPPSLPNLKIIPFLPTDAVEAANTKVYDYYPDVMNKNFAAIPVDLEDDNKAKYIYKFKIEGPEIDTSLPEIIPPKTPNAAATIDSFMKYDFLEKNGFSPPAKTEGGFVPKEPLPIDDEVMISGEFNISKLNEIYPATMHIIDLTTTEPFKDNLTNIIEITTPDPFKDVIHTEPPPDLALIIQDKIKIEATTQKSLLNNSLSKQNIEKLLDLLFNEEHQLNYDKSKAETITTTTTTTSTIPPFKNLPQNTNESTFTKPVKATVIKDVETKIAANQTTRRPIRTKSTQAIDTKNRIKSQATRRPTASLPTKFNKHEINTSTPSTRTTTTTTTRTTTTTAIKTTNLTISNSKPTKQVTTTKTTSTEALKNATKNPFLMSPFDKLPFMDASFEIKRQTPTTVPYSTLPLSSTSSSSSSFPPAFSLSSTLSHSFEKLEGLDAAYDITISSSSTIHPPYALANEQHSISTSSNSLIDPTGILKLAGCNIYGRMYRVGRIILELSSPCVECKCTETGVKCSQLGC